MTHRIADSVIDLLANPKRAAALAERERAARRGAHGWLGMTPRYDPQAVLMFGDGVVQVEVHPRSPAYRAGIRTGDVIKPIIVPGIGQVPLENFDKLKLPARTEVGVQYFRPGGRHAERRTYFKLAPWPCIRQWETRPRVASGRRVMKKDHNKFLNEMRSYLFEVIPPRTAPNVFCYLELLVRVYNNDAKRGVWPRHKTTAKRLKTTPRTIIKYAQMACWFGCFKLLEGPTAERNSNLYEITWPRRNEAAVQPHPVPPPPTSESECVRLWSKNDTGVTFQESGTSPVMRQERSE